MWPQYSALHDKDRRIQGSQCPAAPRCGSGLRAFLLSDVDQKQGIAGLRFCGVCVVVLPCEVRLDVTGWGAGLGRANSTCCGNCFTACLASGCTSRLRADVGLKPAFLQHGSETGGGGLLALPTPRFFGSFAGLLVTYSPIPESFCRRQNLQVSLSFIKFIILASNLFLIFFLGSESWISH